MTNGSKGISISLQILRILLGLTLIYGLMFGSILAAKETKRSIVVRQKSGKSNEAQAGFMNVGRFYDKSWAVVIGIDRYNNFPQLHGAVRDAKAMKTVLETRGFTVIPLLNEEATKSHIEEIVGDRMINMVGENDRVLVYFAGHGVSPESRKVQSGYLLPVDAKKKRIRSTGISMNLLQSWFADYRAKHVMFVADACYSGLAISTRSTGMSSSVRNYLKKVTAKPVRFTLVAGSADEEANEWRGHGLFTYYLLEAIKGAADMDKNGAITSDELVAYIKPNVAQTALAVRGAQQNPQAGRSGEGEFVFLHPEIPVKDFDLPSDKPLGDDNWQPQPDQPLVEVTEGKAGLMWHRLPGGTFKMGSQRAGESPVHEVRLKAFWLTKSEVSVQQYRACVDAGVCALPLNPEDTYCNFGKSGRETDPVNCVNWEQAGLFCQWTGGRLATEAEFEYAAKSGKEQSLPWGIEAPTCERVVMDEGGEGCGMDRTAPVCSKTKGNSIHGLCDLMGNVSEWVQDCYHDNYEGSPTDGSAWQGGDCTFRSARGGAWYYDTGYTFRASLRHRYPATNGYNHVGFRCAKSD